MLNHNLKTTDKTHKTGENIVGQSYVLVLFRGTSSTQYKGHVIRDVTRTADIMAGPENRLRPREPKETRDRPVSANTYTLTGDLIEYSHKIGPTCKDTTVIFMVFGVHICQTLLLYEFTYYFTKTLLGELVKLLKVIIIDIFQSLLY